MAQSDDALVFLPAGVSAFSAAAPKGVGTAMHACERRSGRDNRTAWAKEFGVSARAATAGDVHSTLDAWRGRGR